MVTRIFKLLVIGLTIFVTGQSALAKDKSFPDESALTERLDEVLWQSELTWVVDHLEVTAEGNAGSSVSPMVEQRIVVTMRATEDVYQPQTKFVKPNNFLTRWYEKGATVTLYGIARSQIRKEKWFSDFDFENVKDITAPKPFAYFTKQYNPDRLFVLGTPEGDAALAAAEADRLAREQAAAQAAAEKAAREKQRSDTLNAQLGGDWIGHVSCGMAYEFIARLDIPTPFNPNEIKGTMSLENLSTGNTIENGRVMVYPKEEGEPITFDIRGIGMRGFGGRDDKGVLTQSEDGLKGMFWERCETFLERPDAFKERQAKIAAEVSAFLSNVHVSQIVGTQYGPKIRPGSEWPVTGTAQVGPVTISGMINLHGFSSQTVLKFYGPEPVPYTLSFPRGIENPVFAVEPYNKMAEKNGTIQRSIKDQYSFQSQCGRYAEVDWNPDTLEITLTPQRGVGCAKQTSLRFQ